LSFNEIKTTTFKVTNKGQALVESIIMILLLTSIVSGFLIYIYRTSIVIWAEYNLNQAINCESSLVLQTKKYLTYQKNKNYFNNDVIYEKTLGRKSSKIVPQRKNMNCLAKAKSEIQKITPWEKIEVKKNKPNDEYEVNTKWEKAKILKIEASAVIANTKKEKSPIKDLWSQIYSLSSQ
jgi:hypothetical protein